MPTLTPRFTPRPASNTLAVIVPPTDGRARSVRDITRSIHSHLPTAETLELPYTGGLGNSHPNDLSAQISAAIASHLQPNHHRIILIGVSLGGFLIRRAFTTAAMQSLPWSHRVDRVILIAGMTSGWTGLTSRPPQCHPLLHAALITAIKIAQPLGLCQLLRQSTLAKTPAVTQLQSDWLALPARPPLFQLLGDADPFIEASDHQPLQSPPNTKAVGRFTLLPFPPGTGHFESASFTGPRGEQREAVFLTALRA